MGIPSYFSYIVKNHRDIIKKINTLKVVNNLYLDCNSIIYDVARQIEYKGDNSEYERKVINATCDKIDYYIDLIKPDKKVFIAFDGVAPVAKLEQQRNRRYKSWFQNEILKDINGQKDVWNTSAITPGTHFMTKLNSSVERYFKKKKMNLEIIVATSNVPGEGEHKIYEYIRNNAEYHKNTTSVIYGLDADLIMLTLNHLHVSDKMYLFRETPHFIATIDSSLDPECIYMIDIPELASLITSHMNNNRTPNTKQKKNRLYDYIFLCFFLGNDFMPHFPSVNIRTNGISIVLNAYKKVIGDSDDNLTNGKKIYWKTVRKLIKYLSVNEEKYLQDEHIKRDKQSRRRIHGNSPKDMEDKFMGIPIRERTIEKYINPFDKYWENRYYYMLFDVEIDDMRKQQICVNYLEALEWTMKYYTSGCVDWRWYYKYDYAPLLTDLIKFVPYFDTEFVEVKKKNPIKDLVQLSYVLPASSLNLLPENIWKKLLEKHREMYRLDWKFKWSYCKYFWEAHAIMPEIDIKELEALVK